MGFEAIKTMSEYVLSCCTPADTNRDWAIAHRIETVPFHFYIGDDAYMDDFWSTMKPEEMYARMLEGEDSKTSQVSVGEYVEFFKPFLEAGRDILHVTLSSGISGTLNSALVAAEDLRESYPDRKIYIVDSLTASSGFGLLMKVLADKRDEGMGIDALKDYALRRRMDVNGWFFTSDLTFFIKGGRVSKTAGFFGNLLNICPLLNIDFKGKLIPREKIRTKKKVIVRLVERMEELAGNGHDYDGPCYISHSACPADATAVKDLIEERFPALAGKVEIFPVGPTIGCHTGPGTVALFFLGRERVD